MQTAANLTAALPIQKSPYSQNSDAQALQAKAFNRTIGQTDEDLTPEAESRVYQFFNSQLPALEVPHSQAKALRDYIVIQLNNYLTTELQQPELAITERADSASDLSDQDSSSSTPSTETADNSGSPQSVVPATEDDFPEGLCRQLTNLKATVNSRKLGLDNDKIKRRLQDQLPKKTYQRFLKILKEQPRTEKNSSTKIGTTNRIINAIYIMGTGAYQPFFNALDNCGYHGLFQPETYPGQGDPGSFLSRSNSLPGRSLRHRSLQIRQLSSSMVGPGYPEFQQGALPYAAPVIEDRGTVRPPDRTQSIPIRVSSINPVRNVNPKMHSFMSLPPNDEITGIRRQTANKVAAEALLRREIVQNAKDSRDYAPLPPPPACAYTISEEEPENPCSVEINSNERDKPVQTGPVQVLWSQ